MSTKEKLLSRVKIDDDGLPPIGQSLQEEETKEPPKPKAVKVEKVEEVKQSHQLPQQNWVPPAMGPQNIDQQLNYLNSMSDDQLQFMTNTMKNADPNMIKENYKRTMGIDLTDEQVKNVINMMSPQMMRQAAEMAKNNPDLLKQA